ncbi:MAG: tRNA pseudouridine(55) synthase TruB [Steroidobacteraceae bacterium]|nr:tRNA pseudouridine(55) synthase TruB [Deltaproteobacteria bacterium]
MINGFVIIDKPAGITSHDVVSRVRRIAGTRRVGHTGTLDPFATGVLPIAVNDGTKAIPFLDEGVKCYEALMQLGVATDTLDMTGKVISELDCSSVSRELLLNAFAQFTGNISQIPPMYSAIKQGGQPLYKLARQGQQVERAARQVEIHSLDLLSFTSPFVSFRVTCSRGTYIRTLADDIGALLGCGACLKELRRTASGPFLLQSSISLETLESVFKEGCPTDYFVTPHAALGHLPDLPLNEAGLAKVLHGRSPEWSEVEFDASQIGTSSVLIRLSRDQELVAVAEYREGADMQHKITLKRVFRTV